MKVSEVMTTDVVTVSRSTLIRDAAAVMLVAGVSGLPVAEGGMLVGIITETDFVLREAAHDEHPRHRLLGVLFGKREATLEDEGTVGDVMSTDLVTVSADASVQRAARLMIDHGVKRLPVVDDTGNLLGVISRTDVMRVFVRADTDIASEIDSILRQQLLPIDVDQLEIKVSEGVVTFDGMVETLTDAKLLADLVARIDGVLSVDNRLTWEVDTRRGPARFSGYPQG